MTRWLLAPVDPRPIALLRIGLGALVLADIADRLRQFHTFYTDYGMLARSDVPVALRWPSALNPFFWSGEPAAIGAVFFFGALAAACLLVGWRSRTAAVLTWAFLSALGARNELVLNGADTVMRVLAFWLIFASPGAALSVDARRGAVAAPSRAALIALQAQVAIIYAAAGLHKHGDDWLNGTAIYRVLQIGVYARSWTRALLDHPGLCAFFTYATLALELGFVPLVLSPFRRTLCRAVAIGAACALHLGIFFAMRVGNLVWVMPVALCAFVAPA